MKIAVDTNEAREYVEVLTWPEVQKIAEHGCDDAIIRDVRNAYGHSAYGDALLQIIVSQCEARVFHGLGVKDPEVWQEHGLPPSLARLNPGADPAMLGKLAQTLEVGPDDLRQLEIDRCRGPRSA